MQCNNVTHILYIILYAYTHGAYYTINIDNRVIIDIIY